jgi:hypothetical protein
VIGTLGSFQWGLALALSLTTVAVVSFVSLRLVPQRVFQVNLKEAPTRAFKGGTLEYPLVFHSSRDEQTAHVKLLTVPEGIHADLVPGGEHGQILTMTSKFSGAYSGFSLKVGVYDPIGIFVRYEERKLDLVAEFLPLSLLSPRSEISVAAAILGDRPGGSRGSGQEFYAAELYDSAHESKGILWKRLAESQGNNLMVRVGEANIPETLTICFLESQPRPPKQLPPWMDLASEAISIIGLTIIGTRSTMRIIHLAGKEATVDEARDLSGLADALAWIWRDDVQKERTAETAADAGIVITGEAELQDPSIFTLLARKPSVVLSYSSNRVTRGAGVVFFTGNENISGLVYQVMSR